jgi:hypothetical protein
MEIIDWGCPQAKKKKNKKYLTRPPSEKYLNQKEAGGIGQVEHLLSKCEALSSKLQW